jgi:NlpC/P60 family
LDRPQDAAYARVSTDDRFAIFADPPGVRDLALPEFWERSMARSQRRRAAAAARIIALPKTATARISAALIAAYSYGATGPSSFDCSGLTSWAMRQAGIAIPRTSFAQYGAGRPISKGAIQAGDLVFFNTAGAGASDVRHRHGPHDRRLGHHPRRHEPRDLRQLLGLALRGRAARRLRARPG